MFKYFVPKLKCYLSPIVENYENNTKKFDITIEYLRRSVS